MKLKDTRQKAEDVESFDAADVTFASILGEVQRHKDEVVIGEYCFKELSAAQQRKVINTGFSPVEMFTVLDNVFNQYIAENVSNVEDMTAGHSVEEVTLETKPFFLNVLRRISLGDTYYDSDTKKEYKLPEVTAADLKPSVEDKEVSINDVTVTLSVPNLVTDSHYNELLRQALRPFKKKSLDDPEVASPVYDLIGQYETLKYIKSVSFKGKAYDFIRIPMEQRKKFIDSVPSKTMEVIKNYIIDVKAKGSKATLYEDAESGAKVQGFIYNLFLIKSVLPTVED